MIILCIYLPNFTCVVINLLISAYVKIFINKVVHGTRVHQNTWGECHRHKNGFRKETMRFQTFIINVYLAWKLAGLQTNHGGSLHMHSGFPAKMVEQTMMTSLNDIMRISHVIEGGNYKRGSTTKLEEFGCCYYCHLGVSAQVLGLYQATDPLPRLSQSPSSRMHILRCTVLFVFTISMHPDLFGGFELLRLYSSHGDQGGLLPSPLEPSIE